MHSLGGWKLAQRPNYTTNIDKAYPYSELPYLGEYNLIKVPESTNKLIEHVDYWGEGLIVTQLGNSGFADCYNVNHSLQLVSNGPDRNKKIPNRIPTPNYINCDTSSYIRDNSVRTVTIMGAPINSSCAKDIARIVNKEVGKVITYGFETTSLDMETLAKELRKKALMHYPKYTLPDEHQVPTLFDSFMAFVNVDSLEEEIFQFVKNGKYDNARKLTIGLDKDNKNEVITKAIKKLVDTSTSNIMAYSYNLWNNGAKEIVTKYLPSSFKHIFNEDHVTITDKKYNQALKLDAKTDKINDRLAMGDAFDRSKKKVSWQILPIWENNELTFKLYNVEYHMYVKLDANVDNLGDRLAWGSTNSNETRHRFTLEPSIVDDKLVFVIINCRYGQGLKLDANANADGDRLLWGHNGDARANYDRFKWIVEAW
ncbi:unnamed protein product [Chrysodeixis includens]|uniref:Uncharacterized protein n=1 Tax=Chrysodeixis includens TaxID=689277 RepID=A0A9P0FWA8_CHRIL|nr:unnamed protein product [Chrysodeixis includens]